MVYNSIFSNLPIDIIYKIDKILLSDYRNYITKVIRKRSKIYDCIFCNNPNVIQTKPIIWHITPRAKDLYRGHKFMDTSLYINLCSNCNHKCFFVSLQYKKI